MISISIGPYLRWKLKNLGFEYDPVEDTWFWGMEEESPSQPRSIHRHVHLERFGGDGQGAGILCG